MVDIETPQEREIGQQLAQVTRFRTKFVESADTWRRGIPREFKDMDFRFVADNAQQFVSIRVLSEVVDAKKLLIDWLMDAASRLRSADGELPNFGSISPLEKADRETLVKMLDAYEAKWRRRLSNDGAKGVDSRGYSSGFEGLKLFDGLEFVIAGGALYYDVQAQLLEIARRREINSKPKRSVSLVQVNGYPPVPLCSVCAGLIRDLRAPQPTAPEPVAKEEVSPEVAQALVAAGVAPAPTPAEEIDAPVPVAEIMKKIGPATKEAPKMRALHEHRAKEEWDEVLAQQSEKGE
jgi:hypothetical protein